MNERLKNEARRAVNGLLKMDKMQLIYWLLKARGRDHWLLHSIEAKRHAPGIHLESAQALQDIMDDAGVDVDSAHHNFTRFCDREWWVCSECGLFTDREELTPNGMHKKGCNGTCSYKVSVCDFFEE